MADLGKQPDHALLAPRVCPVVDRLAAYIKLRADGHRRILPPASISRSAARVRMSWYG